MADSVTRPPFAGGFVLSVQGLEIGTFTEVRGLTATVDVEEIVEGGQNQYVHKVPRALKWGPVTLKRGITNSDELFVWLGKCSGDVLARPGAKVDRREATISVLDAAGKRLRSWVLAGAFPVRWAGPTLAASARDLATEELEVAHHGISVQ